jgi:DNA-binding NarL/FixJ family response regulator
VDNQRRSRPARVLIVDGHEVVRLGIKVTLTSNSLLEVCGEAHDGTDAIEKVAELSPDVVVLDLTMPGTNGFETAARIRLIAPSIRIVFFSIHEIPTTARLSGGDAFVSKSSSPQELADAKDDAGLFRNFDSILNTFLRTDSSEEDQVASRLFVKSVKVEW